MKKLFALVLLSLTVAACEPATNDNNSNAKPSTPVSTPAPVMTPAVESSPAVKPQLRAGDKVKLTINGSATDATIVSVDEKAGKVTVKVQGQKEEKTVAITDVVKG